VVALLTIHAGLLAYSALVHSPVTTEVGHLPAGISHWTFGRFDLYRVNPPLVRMVAAAPVMLFGDPKTDWSSYSLDPHARAESPVGIDFVNANGPRVFWLYTIGRWACIPFSLTGAWICYLWARDLYGTAAGLLACTLWCFDPNMLGHGSLMMPDVPAAALGAAACYTFWRWLRGPTWSATLFAGIILGLAELTKTTLIILYPLWPLLWIAYRWPQRRELTRRDWGREGAMIATRIALALYVVNLGYGFEGSFQRLGDYRFQSHVLTGFASDEKAFPPGNRFEGTLLGAIPVPLPANYVQGIDTQKVDFERGLPSYLAGEWSNRGWWYFYLYAAAVKVPVGTWLLGGLALLTLLPSARASALATAGEHDSSGASLLPASEVRSHVNVNLHNTARSVATTGWRDELVVITLCAAIVTFVSAQTGFSMHFRYVFPAYPLALVVVSRAASLLPKLTDAALLRPATPAVGAWSDGRLRLLSLRLRHGLTRLAAGAACVATVFSSLALYPHSLSYFNEAVGGPACGHEHLLGSNIAWGQDLFAVRDWLTIYPHLRPVHLMLHSTIDPRHVGLSYYVTSPYHEHLSKPSTSDIASAQAAPLKQWCIVDVHSMHALAASSDEDGNVPRTRNPQSVRLATLWKLRPVAVISYTVRVLPLNDSTYHVPR
jgi:4-amino-4-deoxy-L-arabinose transferase-like glycosyltransferase